MEIYYPVPCVCAMVLIMQCTVVNTIIPTDHRELSKNLTAYLDYLLHGYNKIVRPGYGGPPVVVTVLMNIRSMGSISETDESYSMDCYFRQTWVDPRLKYSIKGINEITLPWLFLKKIWKPDTFFVNGMKSHLHRITVPNVFVRLRQDGHIIYSQRLTVKAVCPMHLRKFPLDSQKCPLIISSYGYNKNNLIYKWMHNSSEKSVEVSDSLEIAQYDLEKRTIEGSIPTPRGTPIKDYYSVISVMFYLKRQNGYYMLQVYVPCALIVMCSWISFWIDPDDVPARVMLGVTTALSMTTMGFGGKGQMPRVSYPTALDYFVILCFSFIFAVMIEYATINFKDRIRKELKKKLQDEETAAAAASADANPIPQTPSPEKTNEDNKTEDTKSGDTLEPSKSRQRSVSMVDFPVSKTTLEVPTASSTRRRRKSDVHSRSSRDNLSRTGIKPSYTSPKTQDDSVTSGVLSPILKTLGHIPQAFKKKNGNAGKDPKQIPMITITRKRSASNVSDIEFEDNISENMYEVLPGDDMFYDDFSDDDDAASSIEDDRVSQLSVMIGEFASTTRRSVRRCLMKPVKLWKEAKFLPSEEDVFRQLKSKEPVAKFTNVDIQSRKFFPLAFLIFLTVYWVLYLYILTDESSEDSELSHNKIPYFARQTVKSPPISHKM